jgi:hypothetical protein
MVLFVTTVILSACLLFLVQPLIAKLILPWFGGTSAVWSAALVFFQVGLLGGYAYAHWLTNRVAPRNQWLVHGALLLAGCALMPIVPADAWRPSAAEDPMWQILLLLTATVGLPSLLLSATSPLLQVWYMRRFGSEVPYWLFALSNAGSLAALFAYPLLLEPLFGSHGLTWAWSVAFVVFAALCIAAGRASRLGRATHGAGDEPAAALGTGRMLLWMLLSACGSGLLVAASAQLSTNVAPIPLLWVVPLALYLLTFILTFSTRSIYRRDAFLPLLAAALGCLAWLYIHSETYQDIRYVIPLYLSSLFVICMVCHGELVYRRPTGRFLTRFYLLVALGGALGGVFVAVVAPLLFDTHLELPLLLIVIAALSTWLHWRRSGSPRTLWLARMAMLAGLVALLRWVVIAEIRDRESNVLVSRSFYGVLRVRDYYPGTELASRSLVHGTISHGYQYLNETLRDVAGAYYARHSGVGRTFSAVESQGPMRFGVIGLGAGVLSSYARGGDYLRIYEINPDVVTIADQQFSFLSRARQRGADVGVLLGDARLTLERQAPQQFDVLAVDAFSSDAIPTHLLTNEAIELYFRHLRSNGVLAVHISNRYLDLAPVCARAAEHVGRTAVLVRNAPDERSNASHWILITSNSALLQTAPFAGANLKPATAQPPFKGWTDQFSSVWPLLRLGEGQSY